MGSHAGRVRRALLICLASAAVLFASAAPLIAGHLSTDRECAPAVATPHDHGAHAVGTAPDAGPDHCAACHLTRTARNVSYAQSLIDAGLVPERAVEPAHTAAARIYLRTDFTRGPPSFLI